MNSYYGRLAPFCKLASDRPLPPARIDDSKCSMKIHYHSFLEGAKAARGTAVIIDVFRAFTCTPLLFSLGIQKSILVGTPQEAFALKQAWKDVLLIGETGGMPIEGFDLGNSPSEILRQEPSFFKGRTIVQRTSAGVQGALAALGGAEAVLVAGFTVARATADYILSKKPPLVSLVAMGWELKERAPEDECCARYIAHLLGAGDYDHNVPCTKSCRMKPHSDFCALTIPIFRPRTLFCVCSGMCTILPCTLNAIRIWLWCTKSAPEFCMKINEKVR